MLAIAADGRSIEEPATWLRENSEPL